MPVAPMVEQSYLRLMDACFALWPQPKPDHKALKRCRIVSHRGQHDNRTIFENTLAAFDQAAQAGVWGIELDVRWTRDQVPVVHHDATLERVWGAALRIDHLTWKELRLQQPQIPSLEEVVIRYGRCVHLMIERKHETWPEPARQNHVLEELLALLRPVNDYHFMTLTPMTLDQVAWAPRDCLVAIAYHWPDRISRWALQNQWGGFCTHFSLLRKVLVRRHQANRQCVGTGFAASRNCLFREIQRGVDWIFSNHAVELQTILDMARQNNPVTRAG